MPKERTFRLRIRWLGAPPVERTDAALHLVDHGAQASLTTEFGMQRGRWELVPGSPDDDGVTFETEVAPYRDKAGRSRFRGPDVQGPPDEPFLYLSWRVEGEQAWIMRAKVDLAPLTDEFLETVPVKAVLETTVSKLGGHARGHVQEWRAV